MSKNRDDAWNAYPGDQFDSLNRADWGEDDWEAFLLRQDALNAKYQELYETLRDHPRRDELIAREMGWHLPQGLSDARGGVSDGASGRPEDGDPPLGPEGDEGFDAPASEELDAIPAYRMAQDYALAVERQLTARLRDSLAADEDAARSARAAVDVSAEIANGHSLGYDRDSLCGNIACCKRGLGSLAECMDGLLALRQRGVVLPSEADELLRRARQLGDGLSQRIEELRRRVWWR